MSFKDFFIPAKIITSTKLKLNHYVLLKRLLMRLLDAKAKLYYEFII